MLPSAIALKNRGVVMKKLAFGAAFAVLLSAPVPASALVLGADYTAFSGTLATISAGPGLFAADAVFTDAKDDVIAIGAAVSTGAGAAFGAAPMLPVSGIGTLELFTTADSAGEASDPFGYAGGMSGIVFPAAPGEFDVEGVLELKITNFGASTVITILIDYMLEVATDASLLDLPGRHEDALAFAGAAIAVDDSSGLELYSDSTDALTDALYGPTGAGGELVPGTASFVLGPGEFITVSLFSGAHGFAVVDVPLPAALPLLAGALGVFGVMARRRRRASPAGSTNSTGSSAADWSRAPPCWSAAIPASANQPCCCSSRRRWRRAAPWPLMSPARKARNRCACARAGSVSDRRPSSLPRRPMSAISSPPSTRRRPAPSW
jgi:hypothetical protein